jgi:hypothetical protein
MHRQHYITVVLEEIHANDRSPARKKKKKKMHRSVSTRSWSTPATRTGLATNSRNGARRCAGWHSGRAIDVGGASPSSVHHDPDGAPDVGTHDAPQCRQPINCRGIHVSEKKHLVPTPQTWMSVGQHISDSEVDVCVCVCVCVRACVCLRMDAQGAHQHQLART